MRAPALASGALPWFAPGQQDNASAAPVPAAKASAPDIHSAILTLLAACPAPTKASAASLDPSVTPDAAPTVNPSVQAAALVLLAAAPDLPAAAGPAPAESGPKPAATASVDPALQAEILALLATAPLRPALAASPTPQTAPVQSGQPEQSGQPDPPDPDGKAQFAVLQRYFRSQLTLAENFPEVFSRRVKDSETMAFMTMCAMQTRRGLLERFRSAGVDISGLVFTRVTSDPDLARIRVTGQYSFILGPKVQADAGAQTRTEGGPQPEANADAGPTAAPGDEATATSTTASAAVTTGEPITPVLVEHRIQETLVEDALFVLLPEMGEWKIYERREGWQP